MRLSILFVCAILLTSCNGTDPVKEAAELEDIAAFISKKGLNLTKTDSDVYFEILQEGTGQEVQYADEISVIYEGRFLNDVLFDERKTPISFNLRNLIPAWKEVIPGQKVGTKLRIVTPSKMGYRDQDNGDIPPYSTLHFIIEIVEVK